ncbi:MAG: flagellar motor protein MotA, partial [Pseudomonadota bacterium]
SSLTRLGGGPLVLDGEGGGRAMPSYVQALLERSAESTEDLARILGESEATRRATEAAVVRLGDHLERLTQHIVDERTQLERFAASVAHIEAVLTKQRSEGLVLDAASRAHLANLDASMQRLVDEATRGRAEAVETVRREIRLVTRTIALASGEPDPGA